MQLALLPNPTTKFDIHPMKKKIIAYIPYLERIELKKLHMQRTLLSLYMYVSAGKEDETNRHYM